MSVPAPLTMEMINLAYKKVYERAHINPYFDQPNPFLAMIPKSELKELYNTPILLGLEQGITHMCLGESPVVKIKFEDADSFLP